MHFGSVFDDMKTLCRKFFPDELRSVEAQFNGTLTKGDVDVNMEDEIEEEEEEE